MSSSDRRCCSGPVRRTGGGLSCGLVKIGHSLDLHGTYDQRRQDIKNPVEKLEKSRWVDSQAVHEQDIGKVHAARRIGALTANFVSENDLAVHRFGQIS